MGTLGPRIVVLVPGILSHILLETNGCLSPCQQPGQLALGGKSVLRRRKQKCIVMGYRECVSTREALGVFLEET